jgi:hypothetical protein
MTGNLAHEEGEVGVRSAPGEGAANSTVLMATPSPSTLTRLDLSREAGEVKQHR